MTPLPPLVLIHGWGMNRAIWDPLLPHLERHCRPHLIELPGHGYQPADNLPVTLQGWADSCLGRAPERAYWLGWSLGGMVAQQAALDAPERISGLLCIAASPRFTRAPDWPGGMDPAVFESFAAAFVEDHRATLEQFLSLQVRGAEGARTLLRSLKQKLAEAPEIPREALQLGLALLRSSDLRDRLPQLATPSQWLFGERDTLCNPALARAIEELLPEAGIEVFAGTAHTPFLAQPERTGEWVRHTIQALQETS